MAGETVATGFRKLYYGGTSVESTNAMLQDATGKDFEALEGDLADQRKDIDSSFEGV